jgi:hypothetical protein
VETAPEGPERQSPRPPDVGSPRRGECGRQESAVSLDQERPCRGCLAGDELEKRTQPRLHDGRPLPDCVAARARVVGQHGRSQCADGAGTSCAAGSLRAPGRPRWGVVTRRAGTPSRARSQGLLRAPRAAIGTGAAQDAFRSGCGRRTEGVGRGSAAVVRRTDVVGVSLNPEAVLRLTAVVLVEVHDGWHVSDRRHLCEGSMAQPDQPAREMAQPALIAPWLPTR